MIPTLYENHFATHLRVALFLFYQMINYFLRLQMASNLPVKKRMFAMSIVTVNPVLNPTIL